MAVKSEVRKGAVVQVAPPPVHRFTPNNVWGAVEKKRNKK